jgi:hypothetical protein
MLKYYPFMIVPENPYGFGLLNKRKKERKRVNLDTIAASSFTGPGNITGRVPPLQHRGGSAEPES